VGGEGGGRKVGRIHTVQNQRVLKKQTKPLERKTFTLQICGMYMYIHEYIVKKTEFEALLVSISVASGNTKQGESPKYTL